ncbi:MAG: hypothetical protein OEY96_13885 [Gammaproteobacteria bacterium]|nr:hypothetical protein [Gammaproteobacteria bacterium]
MDKIKKLSFSEEERGFLAVIIMLVFFGMLLFPFVSIKDVNYISGRVVIVDQDDSVASIIVENDGGDKARLILDSVQLRRIRDEGVKLPGLNLEIWYHGWLDRNEIWQMKLGDKIIYKFEEMYENQKFRALGFLYLAGFFFLFFIYKRINPDKKSNRK